MSEKTLSKKPSPKNEGIKFRILQILADVNRKYRFPFSRKFFNFIYHSDRRYNDYFDVVIKYDHNLYIRVNSSSYIEWHIFFYGYYEKEIIDLFKRLFKKDFYAFDVGANIGCHTLIMSSLAGENGKIIAIEPHPKIFRKLIENLSINRITNVQALQCALSDAAGNVILHSFAEGNHNEGISSLGFLNKTQNKIQIQCKTLDEIMVEEKLSKFDFIKIDVEGYEYNVLIGAKNSIQKYRPYVLFEYNEANWNTLAQDLNSVRKFFSEMNYSMYAILDTYILSIDYGLPKEVNILAVPTNKKR